jgi:cellulose biosynthesis protein BcsQ
MIPVAFFNNKGGVGKTGLVSHLAWMYANRGLTALAVDLDPQSNLSAMLLTEERLQELWHGNQTILSSVRPLLTRSGDIAPVHVETVADRLHMLVGDLGLSRFEDLLAENWSKCLTGEVGAFRVMSAFHRLIKEAAERVGATLVLIDLGPNLGSLNRAALLAADNLVLPIAPDLCSLQGMMNLGPTLREWRRGWEKRRGELQDDPGIDLPAGRMQPLGYVLMSFGVGDGRPVKAYDDWISKIPRTYREVVLDQHGGPVPAAENDPFRLAALKHYRSLMPLAMAAHKPMFLLKSVDGARGAHLDAVRACYDDFEQLARRIGSLVGVPVP